MIKLYSKFDDSNVDEVNLYWSNNVHTVKSYFSYTPGLAYALHFGLMSYLSKALGYILKEDTECNFMQDFRNSFLNVSWNVENSHNLHSLLVSHESRNKTYNTEKVSSFFNNYDSRTEAQRKEDSSYAVFPRCKKDFLEVFLADLYPSLRNAFVAYLEQNKVIIFDKKDKFVRIKNYKFKLEELNSRVNHFSSQVLLENLNNNVYNFIDLNKILSTFITVISDDINYLHKNLDYFNHHVSFLKQELHKQKQEGINGYLLTWH